jgi:hypothetical protein
MAEEDSLAPQGQENAAFGNMGDQYNSGDKQHKQSWRHYQCRSAGAE